MSKGYVKELLDAWISGDPKKMAEALKSHNQRRTNTHDFARRYAEVNAPLTLLFEE